MQLRVLLLAALSAPLAACIDPACLSDARINSLPDFLWESCRALKALQNSWSNIHCDRETKEWNGDDIETFNKEYFPALKTLVTLAMENLSFIYDPKLLNDKRDWLNDPFHPLEKTLLELLRIQSFPCVAFNVAPAQPELQLPLMLAKADFLALRKGWSDFHLRYQAGSVRFSKYPMCFTEASTFKSALNISRGAQLIYPLLATPKEYPVVGDEHIEYVEAVRNNIESVPILTEKVKELTAFLPQSFSELRAPMEQLVETRGEWWWLRGQLRLWTLAVGQEEERCVSRIWAERDTTASERAIIEELVQAANNFRTLLRDGVDELFSIASNSRQKSS